MRALIADDSSTMRAVLRMILRKRGFEVHEAKDGADAIRILEHLGSVDLILVDWNMPEMNGFELLSSMRRDTRFANTKVMMVTTETALEQVARALEAGANEYIMKPITPEAVNDKLRMLGW
jgi:two-component system chemotaxis response regulator CheY